MADQLSAERAKELLSYCPDTGVFKWRTGGKGKRAGDVAGCKVDTGHCVIKVDQVIYKAHRLAFLMTYGRFPSGAVDHIDGDPSNNKISNLREALGGINQQNQRRAHSRSKSGLLGVCTEPHGWRARIELNGKSISLGVFKTPEEAHNAYVLKKREIHKGCTL